MPKRLAIVDGPDRGRSFLLPEAGSVLVGNSRKHCDICLHDFFVGRVHFQLEIDGDQVLLQAHDTPAGTLIDGAKVVEHEMQLGEVLRAGNSYLRLEVADGTEGDDDSGVPSTPVGEPWKLVALPLERLGELSGHTLGHYELGEVLGKGVFGVVFRAKDVKKDEVVALKVLAPTFPADDAEMQRFIRAAKPLLPLRHPNLVSLHGAGKTGPYVWIAQELVEGESLTSVLDYLRKAAKIKWRRAWRIAVGLARALEFTRQHHLVHGNITPNNILIRASDGQPKLNDLMLQKVLEGSQIQEATLEGKILAELPYLSPEHIDLDATADDLSDLYSLGVVVYALLTGRPPFQADTLEETLTQIREVVPPNPKQFQRAIPDEFKAIVLKMLAKHPEDRYSTAGELLADLEQLAGEKEEIA